MLFILDESVLEADFSQMQMHVALTNLLLSHVNRVHLVSAKKSICLKLIDMVDLGAVEKAALQSVMRAATYNEQIEGYLDFRVRVVFGNVPPLCAEECCIELLSLSESSLQKSILLAEDSKDAELYSLVANCYKRSLGFHSLGVALATTHGGGEETPNVFNRVVAEQHAPCVCITDSDLFYPEASSSKKNKKCKRVLEVSCRYPNHHYVLGVREVENLVPPAWMRKLTNDHEVMQRIDLLESLFEADPVVYKYVDLEHGVLKCWLYKNRNDVGFYTFWKRALDTHFNISLDAVSPCKDGCSRDCRVVVHAWGNLIDNMLAYFKSSDVEITKNLFNEGWQGSIWKEIGRIGFIWGVAAPRMI